MGFSFALKGLQRQLFHQLLALFLLFRCSFSHLHTKIDGIESAPDGRFGGRVCEGGTDYTKVDVSPTRLSLPLTCPSLEK